MIIACNSKRTVTYEEYREMSEDEKKKFLRIEKE